MNNTASFSHYHPTWEGQEFTQPEYTSLIQRLAAKKENEILLVDEESIRVSNAAMRIWQKIKGWFGFENQADPIKVNYQLLKLLRYGETQNYLSDDTIQKWLRTLQNTLSADRNQPYARITALIDNMLMPQNNPKATSLPDRDITLFYRSNQTRLQDSFWSGIYHKYTVPTQEHHAKLLYNQAIIHIKEGRLSEAVPCLKKALTASPHHSQWQFTLASTLLTLSKKQSLEDSITLSKEALEILGRIAVGDDETIFQEKIAGTKKEALLVMDRQHIQTLLDRVAQYSDQDHPSYHATEAVSDLKKAHSLIEQLNVKMGSQEVKALKEEWKQKAEHLFQHMDHLKNSEEALELVNELCRIDPNNSKKCAFYRNLQGDIHFQLKDYATALYCYKEAVTLNHLQPQYSANCMRCHLALAQEAFERGNYTAMRSEYAIIWENASPQVAKKALHQLLENTKSLETTNLKEAITIYHWLVPHLEKNPVDSSSMAHIYQQLGTGTKENLEQAIVWLEKAHTLEPRNIAILQQLSDNYQASPQPDSERKRAVLLETLIKLQGSADKWQIPLAASYLKQERFEEALPLFEQARAAFPELYQEELYNCYMALALKCEAQATDSLEAIMYYQKVLGIASEKQKSLIAQKLLELGCLLENRGNVTLSLQCFSLADMASPDMQDLPPNLTTQAYSALFQESLERQDLEQARQLLKKFTATAPRDPRLISIQAALCNANGDLHFKQGNVKEALKDYQQALSLIPNNEQYQKKAGKCAIELGDRYYALSSFHELRQAFKDLIKHVSEEAPYKSELTSALGAVWGKISTKNKTLKQLGSSVSTPEELEADFIQANELIRSAYDGKIFHKKPEEMPEELTLKLAAFEERIKKFQTLKNALHSPNNMFQEENPADIRTDDILLFYELGNTYQPDPPQEFHRRLYGAYLEKKEYLKAHEIYEKLKPTPLAVKATPRLYEVECEKLLARKELQEAHQLVTLAAAEFPDDAGLKKWQSLIWYKFGEEQLKEKNYKLAFNCLKKSINCGVNAKSESHIALAKLYILAKDNKIQIKDPEGISPAIQAAVHLKQAADLEPGNAELRFQLARLVYQSGMDYKMFPMDVLKYLTEAVALEPKNISYVFALKSWIDLFEQFKRQEQVYLDACQAYEDLGGAPSQHSDIYWTLSNRYQL